MPPRRRPEGAALARRPGHGRGPLLARETTTPVRFIPGTRARLDPGDGHVAMIPAGVPAVVQAMLVAGNELQDLPYGPARPPRSARSHAGGLLEHRQLRPLPLRQSRPSRKSSGTTRSPRITSTGARRARALGHDLCHRRPDPARVHRDRRPTPGHLPRRDRHRPQPRPERSPLADPADPPAWAHWAVRHPPGLISWHGAMSAREVDYLLIGGGLASANCARWLREEGAEGEVLLVGRELDPPYNRPECSKGYMRGEETREEPMFRPPEWWKEQKIELLTGTTVTGLDPARAHGQALEQGGGPLRQGAARQRRQRPPPRRRGLPSSRTSSTCARSATPTRSGKACEDAERGRADRRLLHRLRGGGLADDAGQALLDRDAGAAHPRTRLRRAGRTLLPGACSKSTASRSTPATSSPASRATAAWPRCTPRTDSSYPPRRS